MHQLLLDAQSLADDALLASAQSLIGHERRLTATLVAHLAEIDRRDLALRAGHGSLFSYCRRVLHFSEGEAYGRIEAARAARRFPLILDMLRANELTMTTAALVARHLTPANCEEVLGAARHKTKEEVKELVAALAPRPDVPTTVRKVAAARPSPGPLVLAAAALTASPRLPPPPPVSVAPLAPERFHYHATIDGTTRDLLALARDLRGPSTSDEALLKEALTLLVKHRLRRKFALTERPRPAQASSQHSRHIPAPVKRAVYLRDVGRCAFVGQGGHRCDERRFLELHHVRPYEAGGAASVENIQLLCRAHNQHEARRYFTRDRPPAGLGPDRPGAGLAG